MIVASSRLLASEPAAAPSKEKELTPLVLVPAGSYSRGLSALLDSEKSTITLSAYYIESDEVTNRQYQQCVVAGSCKKSKWGGDPTWPVRGVSWFDAEAYCKWTDRRLPTMAEWEKAAFPMFRGQDGHGPAVSKNTDLCNVLNIAGFPSNTNLGKTTVCKRIIKNPWTVSRIDQPIIGHDKDVSVVVGTANVWDLFGNVAEWVSDWDNGSSYFHPTVLVDPKGPPNDPLGAKVIRGGSFLSKEGIDQSHWRIATPTEKFKDVGFRCAADVKQ